ncbi:hypothetical protein THASP1DRAFT_32145, partial [Thamnocephalis sphaerospora]
MAKLLRRAKAATSRRKSAAHPVYLLETVDFDHGFDSNGGGATTAFMLEAARMDNTPAMERETPTASHALAMVSRASESSVDGGREHQALSAAPENTAIVNTHEPLSDQALSGTETIIREADLENAGNTSGDSGPTMTSEEVIACADDSPALDAQEQPSILATTETTDDTSATAVAAACDSAMEDNPTHTVPAARSSVEQVATPSANQSPSIAEILQDATVPQLPSHDHSLTEDESVPSSRHRRHRSLGSRAWLGLRHQLMRALPHLSRPSSEEDQHQYRYHHTLGRQGHHSEMDGEPDNHLFAGGARVARRERSHTMPSAPMRRQPERHMLERMRSRDDGDITQNAATAPPPYIQGALYAYAWMPTRTSVSVSARVTPCPSGSATPRRSTSPAYTASGSASPTASPPAGRRTSGDRSMHVAAAESREASSRTSQSSSVSTSTFTPPALTITTQEEETAHASSISIHVEPPTPFPGVQDTRALPPSLTQTRTPFRRQTVSSPVRPSPLLVAHVGSLIEPVAAAMSPSALVVPTSREDGTTRRRGNRARSASAASATHQPEPGILRAH